MCSGQQSTALPQLGQRHLHAPRVVLFGAMEEIGIELESPWFEVLKRLKIEVGPRRSPGKLFVDSDE